MIDLFLDDARPCPKGFVLARNAAECVELLRDCEVRVLSLDYDLGWNEPTGMEVVRFMVAERKFPAFIYLHTSSLAGKRQMYEALYASKPEHVRLYGHPIPDEAPNELFDGYSKVENGD